MAEKMLLNEDNKWMIVQCATFSISLNSRIINKNVSDIRIRFLFQSTFWISVSGCKLTILPKPTGKPDSDHLWYVPLQSRVDAERMPILRIWLKVTSRNENAGNTACFCNKVAGRREVCAVFDWFRYKPKVLSLSPKPKPKP